MGVKIKGEYLGNTKVKLTHESGDEIMTCAPKDNRGDGSRFSPTDLTVGALGACVLTIMAFYAEGNGIDFRGVKFEAVKEMKNSPRMIGKVSLNIYLPSNIPNEKRKNIEKAAFACPVKGSLSEQVEIVFNFIYGNK